ncbi:hypothetical protein ES332_A11G012800v1 [Gossypium tomentosum]|uniref:Uncharacterized protein n=1 Tax=Gossypium tomentosum TaxID=34277 RepID=A0A5D2N578_GOSTO|nr:hypothetical protein ES332_A11G012800v1 [Gossypium tomentosum]
MHFTRLGLILKSTTKQKVRFKCVTYYEMGCLSSHYNSGIEYNTSELLFGVEEKFLQISIHIHLPHPIKP